MFRPLKALPFMIAALSVSVCAHAAEPEIITGEPYGAYSMAATRVNYTGEKAQFSLDIPAEEVILNIPGGEPQEADDGSTQWELFYAENRTLYIDCCFHRKEGGYEAEMSGWREMANDPEKYNVEITDGITLDGGEFSIVDMHFEFGDSCDEVIIAEYPLDEGTWLNVSLGGDHSELDGYREDIYSMLKTFSKGEGTAPEASPEAAGADRSSPNTGAGIPAAALISAVGAAAVMTACARK